MNLVYRGLGVVGVIGGSMALLAYAGVLEGGQGDESLLVLGVVFLAFGIPSLIRWVKTM